MSKPYVMTKNMVICVFDLCYVCIINVLRTSFVFLLIQLSLLHQWWEQIQWTILFCR